jgi:probable addiction module antidote protein
MTLATTSFDAAEYLEDDEDIRAFLEETAREGTPEDFICALGVAARAKGMTEIARAAGVTRASLYKSLSKGGNPEFSTVAKVTRALGLNLTVSHA